jgi:uncharacterized iron-regulated protein
MKTLATGRVLFLLLLLVAALAATGCASGQQRIAPERLPTVRHTVAWPGTLADATTTAERMAHPAWAALVEAASRADAVLIGEVHGHTPGLDAAARLFDDIIAHARTIRRQPSLALEFLERDHQTAVDDYLTGLIDLNTLRTKTGRSASSDYGHQDMIDAARVAGLPVAAANAPRRYVRLARTQGPAAVTALTPEQRRHIVLAEQLADAGYARRFGQIMGSMNDSHSESSTDDASRPPVDPLADPTILSFYVSQNVWDATMADSVARLVQAGQRPAVLVVGQFHTDHDGGLARRLRARLGSGLLRGNERVLVISMVADDPPATGLRDEDAGRAHAVVYTGAMKQDAEQD